MSYSFAGVTVSASREGSAQSVAEIRAIKLFIVPTRYGLLLPALFLFFLPPAACEPLRGTATHFGAGPAGELVVPMIGRVNPGLVLKTVYLCTLLLFSLNTPHLVLAESTVQGKIINAPSSERSSNIAAGTDNRAVHSSLSLNNVKMSGTAANSVQSKTAANLAAGERNTASQGALSLSRATVAGSVQNSAVTRSTRNMAVGRENQANQSSLEVKSATVKGGIGNISRGSSLLNAAVGSRNQANQSAAIIRNSTLSGTLSNTAVGSAKVNMAIGTANRADQGSVRVENSRVSGTVANTSTMQKGSNMAVGSGNSASQAAILVEGTKLRGMVVNTTTGDKAVNLALGSGNEAQQSSIVVDGGQGNGRGAAMSQFHAGPASPQSTEGAIFAFPGRKEGQEAERPAPAGHVPGQVVFLVDNDPAGLASLERIAAKYRLGVGEQTVLRSLNRIMVVSSTSAAAGGPVEVARALQNESGVYNPQPNYLFATMGQEDPMRSMQNLAGLLELPKVHGRLRGRNITVAVVDTGVEVEHEDLRSRIVGYHNFIADSTYQGEMHGTAVAGIIAADSNEHGIVGIAPEVSLLALRACRQLSGRSAMGECFSTSLVRSLDTAISARADVVNLSLGAYVNDTLLGLMIDSGHALGMVFAAPVGNDPAAEHIAFPAAHDKVVSVAGMDESGNPLPNRRLAAMADAVAPATHIFTTVPGNHYTFTDGTSLASAAISAIIALSLENRTSPDALCLPRFTSALPWSAQVFSCIGL